MPEKRKSVAELKEELLKVKKQVKISRLRKMIARRNLEKKKRASRQKSLQDPAKGLDVFSNNRQSEIPPDLEGIGELTRTESDENGDNSKLKSGLKQLVKNR